MQKLETRTVGSNPTNIGQVDRVIDLVHFGLSRFFFGVAYLALCSEKLVGYINFKNWA